MMKPVNEEFAWIHVTYVQSMLNAPSLTLLLIAPALLVTQETPTRKMAVVSIFCIKILKTANIMKHYLCFSDTEISCFTWGCVPEGTMECKNFLN